MTIMQSTGGEFRPLTYNVGEMREKIALALGWKWWAFSKEERDDPRGPRTERIVRALRPPDFDPSQWNEWAEATGKVHRLADGTEPIERIQGIGDAYGCSVVPNWPEQRLEALDLLDEALERGWGYRVSRRDKDAPALAMIALPSRCVFGEHDNLSMAISLAFLAAVEFQGAK